TILLKRIKVVVFISIKIGSLCNTPISWNVKTIKCTGTEKKKKSKVQNYKFDQRSKYHPQGRGVNRKTKELTTSGNALTKF
ncbi:hypothetical protein LINPERPRIM_LOCUS469, partial [Linum perenne]